MSETTGPMLDATSAGVVHDLNNFLTAVLGAADAIAARAKLDPDTAGDLANIRASTEAAAALARRLFADPAADAEPAELAPGAALRRIASLQRYTLPEAVELRLDAPLDCANIAVPFIALQRIVMNLMANAAKAMPDGGTLTLRSAVVNTPPRASWRGGAIPRGQYVQIDVQDTGRGIPPDVLPRIFDPFFTTSRGRGGHGLGLAAVDTLVRQAGGFIEVDSREGGGTRVSLLFPARPTAAPPAVPGSAVLLVDDDESILRSTARSLRYDGWQVLTALTAEDALALLDEPGAPPLAAVVTDQVLPGMSGAALIAALRHRYAQPSLPGIVLSGYTRREIAGVQGSTTSLRILTKPCDFSVLAATLRQVAGVPGGLTPR